MKKFYKCDFIVIGIFQLSVEMIYNMDDIAFQKKYICIYVWYVYLQSVIKVLNAINVILKFETNGKIFNSNESFCKI